MPASPDEQQVVNDAIDRLTLRERVPDPQEAAEAWRFSHLVVAVDGSPGAEDALAWARWFATQGARIHLVSALGPPPYTYDSGRAPPIRTGASSWKALMEEEREDAERVLSAAKAQLTGPDVQASTEIAVGSPASVVSSIAKTRGADLLVCGSHDAGALERSVLGSVADGLKQQARCSVLIAKGAPASRAVLLPTDGSDLSRAAVLTGLDLARRLDAPAHLLHVVAAPSSARVALAKQDYAEAGGGGSPAQLPDDLTAEVAFGRPPQVIAERVEGLDAQLVVMGSRGLGGIQGGLLGSVSNPVSHAAKASVLFLKPEE